MLNGPQPKWLKAALLRKRRTLRQGAYLTRDESSRHLHPWLMDTRSHVHEEVFPVTPARLFAALHTPSAIRRWWGAAGAIVRPAAGGWYAATWGADEDDPDYVTIATIKAFDAPRRLVLVDHRYFSKAGPLPFEANFIVEFVVEAHEAGAILRVTQSGFPTGGVADDYYAGCVQGWRDTFAGLRRYLGGAQDT